jgi:DUF1680 family protein
LLFRFAGQSRFRAFRGLIAQENLNQMNAIRIKSGLRISLGFAILLVSSKLNPAIPGQAGTGPDVQETGVQLPDPAVVSVGGVLGKAMQESEEGRLKALPGWDNGELISIFSPESRRNNQRMDWYGEHAGKWLYAAALAVERTGDHELKTLLTTTADRLISYQEPDGYMGTYSVNQRLTNPAASHHRSWDVWNLSYMVLGLLKVNQYFPDERYAQAARSIGELFLNNFSDGMNPVTDYGTRHGISATVILDPVVELYEFTGDRRYLDFARLIVRELDEGEGLGLIRTALRDGDLVNVGDGKAYQLIWNLTAIAKLYRATGDRNYLEAAEKGWLNITSYHLTICGGPWGGVGKFYELFNQAGFWSPYGFTETCSSMSWIQLNRTLFEITGDPRYVQEIEKTSYNALLGARYPDGMLWCYHSFVNGSRYHANFNDCCPSSGAMALEEIPELIFSKRGDGISFNLYTPCEAELTLKDNNEITISEETSYPYGGDIRISLQSRNKSTFPLFFRIPGWADSVSMSIDGKPVDCSGAQAGDFFRIERVWGKHSVIDLQFPFRIRLSYRSESAEAPQSNMDFYRVRWFAMSRGPLVYAIDGLIDGSEREMVFPLPEMNRECLFIPAGTGDEPAGQAYRLEMPGRPALLFRPYFQAGGRLDGSWRLTWVQESIKAPAEK